MKQEKSAKESNKQIKMQESALVNKAESYLKEIAKESIDLENIEDFEVFKNLYFKLRVSKSGYPGIIHLKIRAGSRLHRYTGICFRFFSGSPLFICSNFSNISVNLAFLPFL